MKFEEIFNILSNLFYHILKIGYDYNPSNNGYITMSYSKLTTPQKDFITDYLIKIGDNYTLDKILEF